MKNKILKLLINISLILIAIDQITKVLALKFIKDSVGFNYLGFEVVYNTGMAFGFNSGNSKNIFLTIFVLLVIFNFLKNQIERIDKKNTTALALVIAGGVGNLIDRIFRGAVIDFIKVFKIPNFNFADVYIVVGWILLVVFLIDYTKNN